MDWHSNEEYPHTDGIFLIAMSYDNGNTVMYVVGHFAKNLREVDQYKFCRPEYKREGFYYVADNWGHITIARKHIIAWTPITVPKQLSSHPCMNIGGDY